MFSKHTKSRETALYTVLECSYVGVVKEMIKYHDNGLASLKAKQGDLSNYCFQFLKFAGRMYNWIGVDVGLIASCFVFGGRESLR
jgi:hypothetical protein